MQINIDGKTVTRIAAVSAATLGVGAAAFFGGTATRMSDDARASEKTTAVQVAVNHADVEHKIEVAAIKKADWTREHKHVKNAVKKAKAKTIKQQRKRAEKLAERARSEGYSSGNTAGYGAGHSAGYSEGDADGYVDGLDDGATEYPTCSDDPDVSDLPYC